MMIIALLLGCSLIMATGFLIAFFWSVKNGQNDDLYTPSVRILFDDTINEHELLNDKSKTTMNDKLPISKQTILTK